MGLDSKSAGEGGGGLPAVRFGQNLVDVNLAPSRTVLSTSGPAYLALLKG